MDRKDCLTCGKPFGAECGAVYCSPRCEYLGDERDAPDLRGLSPGKPSLIRVSYKVHGGSGLSRIRRARPRARLGDTQRVVHLQMRNRARRAAAEEQRIADLQRLGVLPAVPLPPADTIASPEPTERTWMYPEPIGPVPYFDLTKVRKESR